MTRGILATCTRRPETEAPSDEDLLGLYRGFYAHGPVLEVVAEPPQTKAVAGSDRAFVHVRRDRRSGMIVALSAIDNLGKGAAGQAIQGFNLAFGFPETAGLKLAGMWP
jgi:N-acetyl-gamma-glutamyl-phosphate reductase